MRLIRLLVVLSLLASACAGADSSSSTASTASTASTVPGDSPVAGMLVASDVERDDPLAPASDVELVVAGLRSFAAELYTELVGDGNMVFSPVSVYTALAMTYAGAAGTTADEMAALLGDGLSFEAFHSAMNAFDQVLATRNHEANASEGAVEIAVANSLWGQQGMAFEAPFLDLLARDYGSGMRIVDFIDPSAREEGRRAINDWVAGETNDRIEELIQQGVLDDMVRLVLVNAVYLDAAWQSPFEPAATTDDPFLLLDGSETSVETMHQRVTVPYGVGEGWQAVRIPYAGNELGMLVVLPDIGSYEQVEDSLSLGLLDTVSGALSLEPVMLSLPKWEMRTQVGLVPPLRALGLSEATSGAADFSGMTGEGNLFISEVVHEAWISADEAGTEAAAATAAIMSLTALPLDPIPFTVDRPFIFALEDIETGSILFMGRVVDPGS